MGTSFFDTVPEMSEFDFDLGTMDTFEDFDINMTGMDIMTDNGADPFGDFSLEKSFDLIELNKSFQQSSQNSGYSDDSSEALLEDFDGEETLKQDIMWSAHSTQSQQIRSSSSRCKSPPSAVSKMSLTPPSSYISQMFQDSPLSSSSSEDDRDSGCEPPPPAPAPPHVTTDHCYTNTQLLTPPESSEDEDSFISTSTTPSSPLASSFSKSRKNCLSTVENDRLYKCLLKSLTHHKNMTTADKPKFKFSVRMKKGSSTGRLPASSALLHRKSRVSRREKKCSRLTVSSCKTLKENEREILFSPTNRQTTIKVPCGVHEKILKGDKFSTRDAQDVHNQMERQRRSDLNQAYATLKDFVPAIAHSDRASKQMVLDKAIEHCTSLRSREEQIRETRRILEKRNQELRKKLQLLESQMTATQVDNAHWEIQGW